MQQVQTGFLAKLCEGANHFLKLSAHVEVKVFAHYGTALQMQKAIDHDYQNRKLRVRPCYFVDPSVVSRCEYRPRLLVELQCRPLRQNFRSSTLNH